MINRATYSWRMPIYAPFTDALEPPTVDPVTDTDMVSVCFNKAYLPFILGALAVYTYDDAFNLDNAPESAAVQRFYTLIGIFAAAIEECGVFDFDVRQNEAEPCILEKFVDGAWVEFANLRLCPPLVRLNINFDIEVSFDEGETWETITENPIPDVPEPEAGQDPLCLASASAVVAFNETYKEVKRLFNDTVSVYTIAAAAISLIGTFIFFPPALPAVFTFFVELYSVLSEITEDEFDSDTQDEFRCILFNSGVIVGDHAEFDFSAVVDEVNSRWDVLSINIWTAIAYLLQVVGADGLNRAGSTGVVTVEDCADCLPPSCSYGDCMIDALGEKTCIADPDPVNNYALVDCGTLGGNYNSTGGENAGEGCVDSEYNPYSDTQRVTLRIDLGEECTIAAASFRRARSALQAETGIIALFDGAGAFVDHVTTSTIFSDPDGWGSVVYDPETPTSGIRYLVMIIDICCGATCKVSCLDIEAG